MPVSKLIKIPSKKEKLLRLIEGPKYKFIEKSKETSEDIPVILLAIDKEKGNGSHSPFFISLMINDLLLHNCMLDLGASANVFVTKVMNQLGLKNNRPYRSVCVMD